MNKKVGRPNVAKTIQSATIALRNGDTHTAAVLFGEVLEHFPKNQRARQGLAETQKVDARAKRPNLTPAMIEAAFALRVQGKLNEALAETQLLATGYPENPVLQNFLAICLNETGQPKAALRAAKSAMDLAPNYPEARLTHSLVLANLGQIPEAMASCQKSLSLREDYPNASLHLAGLYEKTDQLEQAIATLEDLVKRAPKLAAAWNNLGQMYQITGQIDAALTCMNKAVECSPRTGEFYANLSTVHKFTKDDPLIAKMSDLLEDAALDEADRMPVSFALAKGLEDIGDTEAAFDHIAAGNTLFRQRYPYSAPDTEREFNRITQSFDALSADFDTAQGRGAIRPLLIVGMPRSGTTLVEQVLASHSEVFGAGELGVLNAAFEPAFRADTAPEFSREELFAMRDGYLDALQKVAEGSPVVSDKMPVNFRWVGYVARLLPEAKFIHVTRDPVATCWSIYKRRFGSTANRFTSSFEDLVHYYGLYHQMMQFWARVVPDRILTLSYEALTEDPEAQTRRMLAFLGLEWQQQCLDFHQTKRAVRTASNTQVRQRMYTGSSRDWMVFRDHLQPLVEGLAPFRTPDPSK